MSTIELNKPIWLHTPKGEAVAYFMDNMGPEMDTLWGCVIAETGEFWWLPNPQVRFMQNVSMYRPVDARAEVSDDGHS